MLRNQRRLRLVVEPRIPLLKGWDCQNRLHKLLQQTAESQPVASADVLELLYTTIEQTEAAADASEASTQEIKRTWDIP